MSLGVRAEREGRLRGSETYLAVQADADSSRGLAARHPRPHGRPRTRKSQTRPRVPTTLSSDHRPRRGAARDRCREAGQRLP
jgi:hypothetical protein